MLDLKALLEMADIDLAETLVVRHVPVEKSLKRILPWLVVERPDLWRTYQQIQWESLEKAMTRGTYIASFIGQDAGTATFAGFYRIGPWSTLDLAGYNSFPGNGELKALGMSGRSPDMPDWQGIVLTQAELQNLPASWQSALSQWRGIYFIYDAGRQAGYVGSTCGSENILGRWRDYARTGHGGNKELKDSAASDLRFSILQRTSPDLDIEAIVALEASWKQRLHTREFGLNRN